MNQQAIKKWSLIIAPILLIVAGILVYFIYAPNVAIKDYELKITPATSYQQVVERLKKDGVLKSTTTFEQVAGLMKYKRAEVPSGRYNLKEGMSNRAILTKLRSGDQDALNITFNNVRTIRELAGLFSKNLAADSVSLLNAFLADNMLAEYGLTPETAMTIFIPNTYDIFWDISPDKLVKRMKQEADKFWTPERLSKAKQWQLTPQEVYTLASIVEKESNNKVERPTVAGVYLNRLRVGEKLRADPTVVFAVGDFDIRRVLFEHINVNSPYNTYLNTGLPPGPIYMPSTNSIDAVLNAEKHDYLFFCAKPGYNSEHAFAKTAEQHQNNAVVYHRWLENEGIKR